eukprot:UN02551
MSTPPPQQQPNASTTKPLSWAEMSPQQRKIYAELQTKAALEAKRQKSKRAGMVIAGIAATFFAFPIAFTAWKTSQGDKAQFRNKTMSGPGQKSLPMSDYESQNGHFSSLTTNVMGNIQSSLDRQERGDFRQYPSGISPQEQYELYRAQQTSIGAASAQQQLEVFKAQRREKKLLEKQQLEQQQQQQQ